MSFFARPNLDDVQFKQLTGTTLTLSGVTKIANETGLRIIDESGNTIPIIVTGGTDFKVLTYLGGQITLQSSTGGGSGVYSGASPTTCTVGGLTAGTSIYGCNISDILEDILVPTVYPSLHVPYLSSMSISPATTLYEVGCNISITTCTHFNSGYIDPYYDSSGNDCGCQPRTSGATCYEYYKNTVCIGSNASSLPSDSYTFSFSPIQENNNGMGSRVYYQSGLQPHDSSGANYDSALAAGCTSSCNINVRGTYPWYWGIKASGGAPAGSCRPTSSEIKSIITGGTGSCCKVVGCSNSTLCVTFGSTSDDYLWFAIPNSSPSKTCWYISELNKGDIGGAVSPGGNLFPDPNVETNVCSYEGCWNGQSYKIYISNYQTAVSSLMQLRN